MPQIDRAPRAQPLKRLDPTAAPSDGSLYIAHQKVYPREISGRFNTLRVAATITLLGLFYSVPWLRWDDRQAILFDLPARKFHIFGLTFFPQDFFLLTWLLIIAALSLFFFTALAGRLWCGYACPQTVWTEIFVWMERWTEGNRQQRMRLDVAPWSLEKLARKASKQALWIGFSLATGFTFVGYFHDIHDLTQETLTASLAGWNLFWVLFYGFATYGNAGHMREQVCKYMCPYARFQGAMFDRNSLIISYDARRGEPRGSRGRAVNAKAKGLGDCVDCTLCVQACPTGIDIRQGLQLECIACAACIDACDSVMDRMNYARGLIRYTTENALDLQPTRIVRPRTVIYGSLLGLLVIGFGIAVAHRSIVELDVLRDRNALYRRIDGGAIENVYTLRFINKDNQAHSLRVSASGIDGLVVDSDREIQQVGAGEVVSIAVRIRARASAVSGGRDIQIVARTADGKIEAGSKARFIAPVSS